LPDRHASQDLHDYPDLHDFSGNAPFDLNCDGGLTGGTDYYLDPNQIQLNLCIAVLTRPQIQGGSIDLVDERRGKSNTGEIDTFYVMLACIACFNPYVIELR
jgi:hypothetical protein